VIYFVTFIHVVVCLFLIGGVLLQSGKAGDISSAFGGLGSQTAFGPRGAQTTLEKLTIVGFALFIITSVTLVVLATKSAPGYGSVLGNTLASQSAPAKK